MDVVGTRVGQYIIDAIVAAVPMIVLFILGGVLMGISGSGGLAVIGGIIYFLGYIAALVSGFAVYAWWPSAHGGQTPGMGWLGLRIVREEDGGPTLGQHALRWVLLIVDAAFAGIVGLIIMSTSQRKQRLGDGRTHPRRPRLTRARGRRGHSAARARRPPRQPVGVRSDHGSPVEGDSGHATRPWGNSGR